MKKQLFLLPVLAMLILMTASCRRNMLRGEGSKSSATPSVAGFNAVDIDLPIKANITVGSGAQGSIQLNGYENIIKHIKTKTENNTLYISSDLDETWEIDCEGVTAEITLPALTALSLTGAPDANIHGNIAGPGFQLDISGASNVVIDNINVDSFSSSVSGAADIEVKAGTVKTADYEVSGAGKIKAFPLQTTETSASISGAGESEVSASGKLTASISGAGIIRYKGHPAITQEVSGVGTVKDAN